MKNLIEISGEDIAYNISNLEQLVFEVTDACNLRCKYCAYGYFYEGYDKRENMNLPFSKAKLIIDYLYEIWKKNYCKGISYPLTVNFYGGEPLLNMLFIKNVIGYIETLPYVGKKFFYGMTTNGVLLDRHMDYLVEKEFRLLISLDGDKENHSYRVDASGKNSFDTVLANIQLLRSENPTYYDRFVRFNSVLHNKNSVVSIYNFINNYLGKKPNITPLNNSGIKKDKENEFNKTYQNIQESFDKATNCSSSNLYIGNPKARKLTEYIYYDSGNVFLNHNALFCDKKDFVAVHKTGTCIPFSKKMFITVRGRILQCEKIDHDFSLGYITDDNVVLDFDEAASFQNECIRRISHVCSHCALFEQCSQCVYFISDLHGESPECGGFCTMGQFEARLRNTLEHLNENPELYKKILRETVLRS